MLFWREPERRRTVKLRTRNLLLFGGRLFWLRVRMSFFFRTSRRLCRQNVTLLALLASRARGLFGCRLWRCHRRNGHYIFSLEVLAQLCLQLLVHELDLFGLLLELSLVHLEGTWGVPTCEQMFVELASRCSIFTFLLACSHVSHLTVDTGA